MPTYRVTAPDGRVLKLTGDSPPTEAELEDLFKQQAQPAATAPEPGLSFPQFQSEFSSGFVKKAGSTAAGLGKLFTKGANWLDRSLPGQPAGELPTEPFDIARQELQGKTPTERLGGNVEQGLEFFAPGGGATKPLSLAVQEALRAMAISSGQKGELDPAAGVVPGVLAGSIAKVARLAPYLKDSAARLLEKTASPSGVQLKEEAARAAPYALEHMSFRDIAGKSRKQLAEKLGEKYTGLQKSRSAALDLEKAQGTTTELAPVWDELTQLESKLKVGEVIPDRQAYKAVTERMRMLQGVFEQYGGTRVPIEVADQLRSILAKPLWKTGALPANLLDASRQGSAELVSSSIRRQLPEKIQELGSGAHKFGTLRDLTQEADLVGRTSKPGMAGEVLALRNLSGAAIGGGVGFGAAGPGGAAVGAAVPFALLRLINSPRWMTFSAAIRNKLGQLIEASKIKEADRLAARLFAGTTGEREEQ